MKKTSTDLITALLLVLAEAQTQIAHLERMRDLEGNERSNATDNTLRLLKEQEELFQNLLSN